MADLLWLLCFVLSPYLQYWCVTDFRYTVAAQYLWLITAVAITALFLLFQSRFLTHTPIFIFLMWQSMGLNIFLFLPLSSLSLSYSCPASRCCCLIIQTLELKTSKGGNSIWSPPLKPPMCTALYFSVFILFFVCKWGEMGVVLHEVRWQHGFLTLLQIN